MEEILNLVKENNKILKAIWNLLNQGNPNNDLKDFMMNVIANQFGRK